MATESGDTATQPSDKRLLFGSAATGASFSSVDADEGTTRGLTQRMLHLSFLSFVGLVAPSTRTQHFVWKQARVDPTRTIMLVSLEIEARGTCNLALYPKGLSYVVGDMLCPRDDVMKLTTMTCIVLKKRGLQSHHDAKHALTSVDGATTAGSCPHDDRVENLIPTQHTIIFF